jgi:hypothetical protein
VAGYAGRARPVTGVYMQGAWSPLDAEHVAEVGGYMGVYQLASPDGQVVFIGYAGGRSVLGLRGELSCRLEHAPDRGLTFRFEITTTYLSRYKELLMVHLAEHGSLPTDNPESATDLGRLTPG